MTVFGQGDNPTTWHATDGALQNEIYNNIVIISDVGRVTDFNTYFGGDTAGCTGGPVLYDGTNGNVLFYTAYSVARGTRSASGGFTLTTSVDYAFTSGKQLRCGGFRNSADSWVTPYTTGSGNYSAVRTTSGTAPFGAAGGTDWNTAYGANGGFEGYGHYFPVVIYVKRSGAWAKVQTWVERSGGWGGTPPKIYVKRSGSWTQVGIVANKQELDWKKEFRCLIEWAKGVWDYGILRWEYDNPKEFGRADSGLLVPA